jgi:hypothetical protein
MFFNCHSGMDFEIIWNRLELVKMKSLEQESGHKLKGQGHHFTIPNL